MYLLISKYKITLKLLQDEATEPQRVHSSLIRNLLSLWRATGAVFKQEHHREIAQLLMSQAHALLELTKGVSTKQRAATLEAVVAVEQAVGDTETSLETLLSASSNLDQFVRSLSS